MRFSTWWMGALARRAIVLVAVPTWMAGCSGDDDESESDRPLKDGDPDACERDCDQQVAAGCASTPAEYGALCKTLCESGRTNTPAECQAKLRAIYQCALEFITYSCENDSLTVSPTGGCAPEAAACAECAGTVCGLPDLG